ncbi:hypothetical protein VTK56DRAFT_2653 [Thermocarpiscus australiensis]
MLAVDGKVERNVAKSKHAEQINQGKRFCAFKALSILVGNRGPVNARARFSKVGHAMLQGLGLYSNIVRSSFRAAESSSAATRQYHGWFSRTWLWLQYVLVSMTGFLPAKPLVSGQLPKATATRRQRPALNIQTEHEPNEKCFSPDPEIAPFLSCKVSMFPLPNPVCSLQENNYGINGPEKKCSRRP